MFAIAGAAIAILVLGLLWMLFRRRRRAALYDEQEWVAEEAPPVIDAEPARAAAPMTEPVRTEPRFVTTAAPAFVTTAAPAFVAAAAPAPAAASASAVEGPVTELPEGFDLSRFGHNVQQAYMGPTTDNPSLSLKHRLRKAAAMDQMERNMDAEVEAATGESVLDEAEPTPPASPPARPAVADPAPGEFLLTKPGKEPAKDPARTH
jgi:hypothetical protein